MCRRLPSALAAALTAALLANSAAAEPLRIKTPAQIITQGGSTVQVPPGRYIPEPEWLQLDLKVKDIQTENTRLKAENQVFREESGPGWITIGILVSAFAGGIYVGTKF
jgi:hypothetical protein